jgi:hypothetical protein
MVDVKARELTIARQLYAEAYEPVRATPTLDVLERQQRLLGAADSLEKRAHEIHDWHEGIFARVLTIATSVVGITVARLILDPLGLGPRLQAMRDHAPASRARRRSQVRPELIRRTPHSTICRSTNGR